MDVTASAGMDYGAQKKLLAASDLAARLRLAAAADTRPEILYYWASDESTEVRQDAIGDSDQGFVIQGIALKSGLPSECRGGGACVHGCASGDGGRRER